jgi:squalene synthase HpnC
LFAGPKEFIRSPDALGRAWSPAEALEYTRWLATSHYENFHVVTLLLPRRLHQDFFNVYAFCRWADDLGDELEAGAEALHWLAWWRGELERMYRGEASHPVFIALQPTVARHEIPIAPFADLIHAFEQDQSVKRYRDFDQLFGYCRYSANPVGRLLLYLCGYRDDRRQALSDKTCTALQLANLWQDVGRDLDIGRIYLPLSLLEAHGSSEAEVLERRATPGFRAALAEAVAVARRLFLEGLPLSRMVNRRLALDVDLFSRGGMRVLDKIERQQYDVFARRPRITKADRVLLLLRALPRVALPRVA